MSTSPEEMVARVMRRTTHVPEAMSVLELWTLFVERGIEAVAVVDAEGRPVGLIRRGDVERWTWRDDLEVEDGCQQLRCRADQIMSAPVATVPQDASQAQAAAVLRETGIDQLSVVDDEGILVGAISALELQRALLGHPQPRRILIVDDDRSIRETLAEILADEGYQVSLAQNGAAALADIRKGRRPDVILLDLMMPVMSGWELLEQLDQDDSIDDIPVIVISALPTARVPSTVKRSFGKPLDLGGLLDAISVQGARSDRPH